MKKKNIRQCVVLLCSIVLAGFVSQQYNFRLDLTAEKRYTLSPETKQILRGLDAPLYVNVYLDGKLPVQFRKFRNNIREMLDEFKANSGSRIIYRFIDPADVVDRQEREELYADLEETGIRGITLHQTNKDGSLSQQLIFPGVLLSYKDRGAAVNLLRDQRLLHSEMQLNESSEALEYELIKTVNMLCTDSIGSVAFTTGHGELDVAETYDLFNEILNYYHVDFKAINGKLDALDPYKAVIIAKPSEAFDDRDKFVIDRYIMRGGKVMWLINGAQVNTDSLESTYMTFAFVSEQNLVDQLFTYGVRINPVVVQDIEAGVILVKTTDESSQILSATWLYYPLVTPSSNHVITRNLNPVWLRYASDMDTVGQDSGIRKTVLLQTSEFSRTRSLPFMISLDEVQLKLDQRQFNKPQRITAVLLEGSFQSVFRSRNVRNLFPELQEKQAEKSIDTKMLVVADGNIARNNVRYTQNGPVPSNPLGHDRATGTVFGNKEFLINALNYLTDDAGLMNLRNREFKIRLLNKQKVVNEHMKWKIINLVLPMLLLLVGGLAYHWWRRWCYGK